MEENVEQTPVSTQVEEQLSQPEISPIQETVAEAVVVEEKLETVETKTEVAEEKLEVVEEKMAVSEEKVEVAKEELSKESVDADIIKTKEELSIIKEVREELVNLYSNNKELSVAKEQLSTSVETLSSENQILKLEVEKLTSELKKYKEIEELEISKAKNERLEKLSAKFKVLGQEKSVEQLSSKDEEILSEFERIVDAAIEKLEDSNREAPAVTVSTQAEKVVEAIKVEQKTSDVVAKAKPIAKKSNEDFFAKLCGNLTKEQVAPGTQRAKVF